MFPAMGRGGFEPEQRSVRGRIRAYPASRWNSVSGHVSLPRLGIYPFRGDDIPDELRLLGRPVQPHVFGPRIDTEEPACPRSVHSNAALMFLLETSGDVVVAWEAHEFGPHVDVKAHRLVEGFSTIACE